MIRINLLPAELRRRKTSEFNPDSLILVAGVMLVLLVGGCWAWLHYIRIPHAQKVLVDKTDELRLKKEEADKVRQMEAKIKDFEDKVKALEGLIGKKVYWAETLNDLAELIDADDWTIGEGDDHRTDLRVACRSLTLKEQAAGGGRGRNSGATKSDELLWDIDLEFQLVGTSLEKRDDYLKAFYHTLRHSDFWSDNDIWARYPDTQDPQYFYKGDDFKVYDELQLVEEIYKMSPQRYHKIEVRSPGQRERRGSGDDTSADASGGEG